MARNILTVDSSVTSPKFKQVQIDALYIRANTVAIGSGVASIAVTFTAVPSTSYVVTATLVNTTDANPQFQAITITAMSTTGFTAKWNANTDSANYVLHYHIMPVV